MRSTTRDGRRRGQSGLTLIEMVIAIMASTILVLALSRMAVSNQRLIVGGRDQAVLQQEMARLIETVSRDIHVAHAVAASGDAEFRTFDASGAVLHVFRLDSAGAAARFQRDGVALTDRICAALSITTNADSTALALDLSLADDEGNASDGFTQVCVRNRALEF